MFSFGYIFLIHSPVVNCRVSIIIDKFTFTKNFLYIINLKITKIIHVNDGKFLYCQLIQFYGLYLNRTL